MKHTQPQPGPCAVCLDNANYPASLEVGKLYRVVPNDDAAAHGYLTIIDESGEAYAYASTRFFLLDIPDRLRKALRFDRPLSSKRQKTLDPSGVSGKTGQVRQTERD